MKERTLLSTVEDGTIFWRITNFQKFCASEKLQDASRGKTINSKILAAATNDRSQVGERKTKGRAS